MKPNQEDGNQKWKKALTHIIEELSKNEFEKMLHLLDDIPESKKEELRDEMPQIIIKHLGIKKSILKMKNIMEEIPRRDPVVQDLLRPFVDKQSKTPEENKGAKRPCVESDTEDEEPEAASKKQKCVNESETESEEDCEEKKHQSDKGNAGPSCEPWRQTIQDLNAIGYLKGKAIKGKVIQKSGLRPYETKKKEKKVLFYVSFADDTGATKLTVYGRPRFDKIQEGHFYKLKDLLVDEYGTKVTVNTVISMLGHNTPLTISADLEMKAKGLINIQWPVFSIAEANNSQEKTEMTIEGTIIDMNNVEDKKVKGVRKKKKLRKLTLQDASGSSIRVCFWGDQVDQCSTLSVGETIRVANVRSTEFMETMSLNSTGMTCVYPGEVASVQTGQIYIIGVIHVSKKKTTLEAELNQQEQKFVLKSKLLAKACGFRLGEDIEDKLLAEMPFWAEVTMQGNTIAAITKM